MKKSKKDNQDYIAIIEEWEDHQYDPGYYTNGKVPPHIKYNFFNKGRFIGNMYILGSCIFFLMVIIPIVFWYEEKYFVGYIFGIILFGGLGVTYFLTGSRLILKAKAKEIQRVMKKAKRANRKG